MIHKLLSRLLPVILLLALAASAQSSASHWRSIALRQAEETRQAMEVARRWEAIAKGWEKTSNSFERSYNSVSGSLKTCMGK